MNVTDPISDLLTRIRNAQSAGHALVTVPASRVKIAIVHLLKQEGYVRAYRCIRDNKQGLIKISLKYNDQDTRKSPVISSLRRASKPGCRRYLGSNELRSVKNGFGIGVVSTSQGIMTFDEAKKRKIGGEHLCSVY